VTTDDRRLTIGEEQDCFRLSSVVPLHPSFHDAKPQPTYTLDIGS